MSKQTTALLTVGPRSIAPWGDRQWRVAIHAQLVSANSGDYWLVSPTEPAEHPVKSNVVGVEMPSSESVIESILMLLSAYLGDANVEGYLRETANIELVGRERVIAPYFDVSAPETMMYLAARMSDAVRLGITVLDEMSLVDADVIATLRSWGFDVDVYTLDSTPAR
jgi:ribosomal protein S8